ncbi:hypothetical protein [Azospirillum doebereinerae]
MKTFLKATVGVLALVAVGAAIIGGGKAKPVSPSNTSPVASAAQPSPLSAAAPAMPADQVGFLALIEDARNQYNGAANDMAAGGLRAARRDNLCRLFANGYAVRNWVGQITTLSSNSDGKGVLAVEIAKGVELKTWNNALSDVSDHTLLDPSSPLFTKLSQMSKNTAVMISGRFLKGKTDCVAESSLSQAGSMRSPEFIFAFSDVQRL